MKRIDELGISPLPWHAEPNNTTVDDNGDDIYFEVDAIRDRANARLIAAAPELYECLREAVDFIESHADVLGDNGDNDVARMIWVCNNALAKAAGEEVKDA